MTTPQDHELTKILSDLKKIDRQLTDGEDAELAALRLYMEDLAKAQKIKRFLTGRRPRWADWLARQLAWRQIGQRLAVSAGELLAVLGVFVAFAGLTLLSGLNLAGPIYAVASGLVGVLFYLNNSRRRTDLLPISFLRRLITYNLYGWAVVAIGTYASGGYATLLVLYGFALTFYSVLRLVSHLVRTLFFPSARLAKVRS